MGVGADHQAGATVAEVAHGHLLAGHLGVHVHDDGIGRHAQRAGRQLLLHGAERVVHRIHVHAAQHVHHQNGAPALRFEQIGPRARRVHQARIVQRPDQARLAHDVGQGLALVPAVVAQRQAVGARHEQLARGVLGYAEATGGVLGVHHHEIEPQVAFQPRQMIADPVTPGLADHVAKEGQSHVRYGPAGPAGQSSQRRPSTRANSRRLPVTTISERLRACPAINRSLLPIIVPRLCNDALMSAA